MNKIRWWFFSLLMFFFSSLHVAFADEINRYVQGASDLQSWTKIIYETQTGKEKISYTTAQSIAKSALIASSNYNVPMELILAVMKIESGFNPKARSRSGALGLMQVMPYWHRKVINGRNLFHIEASVDIGTQILKEYLDKSKGSVALALKYYCGYSGKSAWKYIAYVKRSQQRYTLALNKENNESSLDTFIEKNHYWLYSSSLVFSRYENELN